VVLCCLAVEYFIFYTDWHDVDEDLKTIPMHGGTWYSTGGAGVTKRDINFAPTVFAEHVASM